MAENQATINERRAKLDDLLRRIGREPASEWGFKTERERMLWTLGKMAEVFKARAETALHHVKERVRLKKKDRHSAKHAPEAKV